MADTIGCEDRELERLRDAERRLIPPLLLALMVPLHFDVYAISTKDSDELLNSLPTALLAAGHERRRQRSFIASGQADQAGGVLLKVLKRSCTFALA
jgi:hypothetical protein